MTQKLSILPLSLAVCRLAAGDPIPTWAVSGQFFSVTHTPEELSIVCDEANVPPNIKIEGGWRGLKLEGPLDFALIGILARITDLLAQAEISLFAISTFDTDYILIKEQKLDSAIRVLKQAGYQITNKLEEVNQKQS